MSWTMQINREKRDLSLLWKPRSSLDWQSPIPFSLLADVRPGFCFSTLSNGRCGNQLPQPLSKMQCCCDSGRCWASAPATAPEMCPIRSTGMSPPEPPAACLNTELAVVSFFFFFLFSRNVFIKELKNCTEWLRLKDTLADCLVQLPCSSKASCGWVLRTPRRASRQKELFVAN